jgi:RHS repeat-associated protein
VLWARNGLLGSTKAVPADHRLTGGKSAEISIGRPREFKAVDRSKIICLWNASISPTIGGVGNPVTINGSGFHASQGSNWVAFNGWQGNVISWSDNQIVATVPSGSSTGPVKASVNGAVSNLLPYTVPNLVINTLSPSTGPVGTQVTLTGVGFGASQGTSVLSFNGQPSGSISSWSDTQIIATVPVTAASGPTIVRVNNIKSNATNVFSVPPPIVNSYSLIGGATGTTVTINGSGYQASQRNSTITFNGVAATATTWTDTQIVATVPSGASTGQLLVTVNSVPSASSNSFEVPNPAITSITPPEAPAGGTITINGSGFGPSQRIAVGGGTQYVGSITLNGADVGIAVFWSDTSITVALPSTATSGSLTVTKYNATNAFGEITNSTGSFINPFQYTGRDSDLETGLRYYRARYYAPDVGRFLNEDPLGPSAGPDLYLYVKNDSPNTVDPTGLKGKKPKVPEPSPTDVFFVCCKKGQLAVCEANGGQNGSGGASPVTSCEYEHEGQHISDFKKDCPAGTQNFCTGKPNNTPVGVSASDKGPVECRAYCAELKCLERKGPSPEVIKRKLAVERQIKENCGAAGCPK